MEHKSFCLLVVVFSMFICQSQAKNLAPNTKVRISIPAYKDSFVRVTINIKDFSRVTEGGITDSLELKNGDLQYDFQTKHPVYLQFKFYIEENWNYLVQYGPRFSFLAFLFEPGDSVHINLDKDLQFDKANFSGRGSEKFKCSQEITRNFLRVDYSKLIEDTLNNFFADSLVKLGVNIIDRYKRRIGIVTCDLLKAEIRGLLEGFEYEYFMLGTEVSRDMKLRYFQKIGSSKIPGTKNIHQYSYGGFINMLIRYAVFKYMFETGEYIIDSTLNSPTYCLKDSIFYLAVSKSYKPSVRNLLLSHYLTDRVSELTSERRKCIERFLRSTTKDNSYHIQVKNYFDKWKKNGQKGVPAYNFSLKDSSGKMVSLSDYRGKIVVIDFMFYGCGGCAALVPVLSKIEEEYRNDERIVFISVSVDKDISTLKKGIGIYSASGSVPLFTNGQTFKHPVIKYYDILIYPSLMVIDDKGVLQMAHVPNPRFDNGKALHAIINKLLSEVKSVSLASSDN